MYSCHLFLISSTCLISLPLLSFIVPIFAWNVLLVSLSFLKRSLGFPILLFFSIYLHCSFRKVFFFFPPIIFISWRLIALQYCSVFSYLSLLFFGTLYSYGYIFPYFLCLSPLFFLSYLLASSDNQFAYLHFFFLGMVLITEPLSIVLQTLCLSDLIPWICHFHCIIITDLI